MASATEAGSRPVEALAEQAEAVRLIEGSLGTVCAYERITYLMLMMVDPNVHFHVIPRYSEARAWNGIEFADTGWPGPPQLGTAIPLSAEQVRALVAELSANFG